MSALALDEAAQLRAFGLREAFRLERLSLQFGGHKVLRSEYTAFAASLRRSALRGMRSPIVHFLLSSPDPERGLAWNHAPTLEETRSFPRLPFQCYRFLGSGATRPVAPFRHQKRCPVCRKARSRSRLSSAASLSRLRPIAAWRSIPVSPRAACRKLDHVCARPGTPFVSRRKQAAASALAISQWDCVADLASHLRIEERELEAGGLCGSDRPLAARLSLAPARTSRGAQCRT